MRKLTFFLSLVMIFIIPWEDSISITSVGSLTRMIGLLVAGLWFFTILVEGHFRKFHLFHAFVLIFFLWNIASYIWSIDTDRTIVRIKTYLQLFLLLLIFWEVFKKPSDLLAGIQVYVFGGFVCIASLFINYFNGTVAESYEVRYSASGVNAVDLALLLLLGIPIAWHLFIIAGQNKNHLLQFINISYIPLAVFSILLTGSRTSLFAILPALIFIFWPKHLNIGRILLTLILIIFLLILFQAILPTEIIERFASTSTSISSSDIGGRVTLWKRAISLFLDHPILGSGSGTSPLIIGSVAHQTFLSILSETGLIGFITFISILAIVINQAIKLPKGYSGLWLSVLFVWTIGVLSLSWDVTKATWLILSFVIIEGESQFENKNTEKEEVIVSEIIKSKSLSTTTENTSLHI